MTPPESSSVATSPRPPIFLLLALVCSGAAALVYESAWARMLQRIFGVSDLAIATVLAVFFLGMGLGSAAAGRLAQRLRRPAWTYAVLECAIGLYAIASLALIPRVHSLYSWVGEDASFSTLTLVRFCLALLILLPPTMLMGATLPVLVAAIARSQRDWSAAATSLYASNTLGAVLGAGACGFWLLPSFGTRAALVIAAGGSLLAAAIVRVGLRETIPSPQPEPEPTTAVDPAPAQDSSDLEGSPRLAALLAAMAGFSALAGEVLWTRVLRIVFHGTTQAFAAMLVNYLAGIAIGSYLAERISHRARTPYRAFAYAQSAVAAFSVLSLFAAPHIPRIIGLLRRDPSITPHEVWVICTISAGLLFPLALAIGATIPLAWRIAGGGSSAAAGHSGRILATNTFGGLLGSLGAGFVLVPYLGVEGSILVMICACLVTAALALYAGNDAVTARERFAPFAVPLAVALVVGVFRPTLDLPFLLLSRFSPVDAIIAGPGPAWSQSLKYLREGRNTTVTISEHRNDLILCNDGRNESGFSVREPGFGTELTLLGGLPSLLADQRERAMVIGLGAGHSTTVLLRGPWQRVDVVELEEVVVDAARVLHEMRAKPFPLDDPRTRLIIDDARARLVLAAPGSYDTVVSQPSHPWLAGAGALYTQEFFEEVRRALRPGGVFSLWVNLFRIDVPHLRSIVGSLRTVFPHVQGFIVESSSLLLAASTEPHPLDARVAERLAGDSGLSSLLGLHGIRSLSDLAATRELDEDGARRFGEGTPVLVDDRPTLEFDLAQFNNQALVSPAQFDAEGTQNLLWLSASSWTAIPTEHRVPTLLARIERVKSRRGALVRVRGSADELARDPALLSPQHHKLVNGALAEAIGDVRNALANYESSELPEGILRADELRRAQGNYNEILRVAGERTLQPGRSMCLLQAAAYLQTDAAATRALELAERIGGEDANSAEAVVLRAWREKKAEGVVAVAPDRLKAAMKTEEFAFLVMRCALDRGDLEAAREGTDALHLARAVRAAREAALGSEAAASGNLGSARMHLMRSLAAYPAYVSSAAQLARVLHSMRDPDGARRVLLSALDASSGLPDATWTLANLALELKIDIGIQPQGPDSGTSAQPTPIDRDTDMKGGTGS